MARKTSNKQQAQTVQKLYEELNQEILSAQIAEVKAARRMMESGGQWGDLVDRHEYLRDEAEVAGFDPRMARPDDFKGGDFRPFWTSEMEHAAIRGICRFVATTDGVALSALDNLANYTLDEGLAITFSPKEETGVFAESEVPPEPADPADHPDAYLAEVVQEAVEQVLEKNGWCAGLERECFIESREQGENFIALEYTGGFDVELLVPDPSYITEPSRPDDVASFMGLPKGLNWRYGIATAKGRTHDPLAYFCLWEGDPEAWECYEPDRMVHTKLNVNRKVKRGLSDLFPIYRGLERASKLFGNTIQGAAVQAAIAYIREHAQGITPDQIQAFRNAGADAVLDRNTSQGQRRSYRRKINPGTIVDLPQGAKYYAGPMGQQQGPSYVAIIQAAYRVAGIRWTMPEYMISGDASNANFASTLVAESPFVKAAEARQGLVCAKRKEMAWKIVKLLADAGKLQASYEEIRRKLECKVTAQDVAARNKKEEFDLRKGEHDEGMLSLETWASEQGRDLKAEQAKGAVPKPEPAMIGLQTASGGGPRTAPPGAGGGKDKPAPSKEAVEAERLAIAGRLLWENYP